MEKRLIRLIVLLISFLFSRQSSGQLYRLPLSDCSVRPCYPTAYVYHNGNDWNCGGITYKKDSGYEHAGTDFGIGGFEQMDLGRPVVAAYDCEVTAFINTCDDDRCNGGCCKCKDNDTKNGFGNYVKCKHRNGKITLYGHLRTGSIPANIKVGSIVPCGGKLGEVGSSGCSTGPHLHFEARDANGNTEDPFNGPCNQFNGRRWFGQGCYGEHGDRNDNGKVPMQSCLIVHDCDAPDPITPPNNATNVVTTTSLNWFLARCNNPTDYIDDYWSANVHRVQVYTSPDFPPECDTDQKTCDGLIVLNDTTSNYVSRITIPAGKLNYETTYYWRVRGSMSFYCQGGLWSQARKFTTKKRESVCIDCPWMCANNQARTCYDGPIKTVGVGICKYGVQNCVNNEWSPCTGQVLPKPETCDNKDNNCNGKVDEGLTQVCNRDCGEGVEICADGNWVNCDALPKNSCDSCENTRPCQTPCGEGGEWCNDGIWVGCDAPKCPDCIPSPETCDNKDNNCNGKVDEGLTQVCNRDCGEGVEICADGNWVNCDALPKNSCDSCENTRPCHTPCGDGGEWCNNGNWVGCDAPKCPDCVPSPEVCNNKDDDCDNEVDEKLTRACKTICGNGIETCSNGQWWACTAKPANSCKTCSSTRACQTPCGNGTEECKAGNWVNCNAPKCPDCVPSPEICDNKDNNCDGKIDENLTRQCNGDCGAGVEVCNAGAWANCTAKGFNSCGACEETRACNTPCGAGIETCNNGNWVNCTAIQPQAETCNNQDDNCNGQVDDGLTRACNGNCGAGIETCAAGNWINCTGAGVNSCGVCGNTRPCVSACGNGTETCVAGNWVNCSAPNPQAEVCDNKDNDCDGQTDENLVRACNNGCNNGTQTCVNGVWNACNAVPCPPPLNAVVLKFPPDGYIREVSEGAVNAILLQWNAVAGADNYDYVTRQDAFRESGQLIFQGNTGSLAHSFSLANNHYGIGNQWKVRARKLDGTTGPWSVLRRFFFSHPIGSIITCSTQDCAVPGASYLVTGQVSESDGLGLPSQLIIEWVSGPCLGGRATTKVPWAHMGAYKRSAEKGGCP